MLAAVAFALGPRPALAQPAEPEQSTPEPTSSSTEQARALYIEGKALRRQGELEKSLEKFRAAYAMHPTAITALELGRARALLGRLRGAIEVLESIERIPARSTDSDKAADARVEAKDLAAEVRRRAPTLRIAVDDADARVWVDGETIPTGALDQPWMVDPGPHHVEAASPRGRDGADVRVAEGEERAVRLHPAMSAPAAATAKTEEKPPASAPVEAPSAHRSVPEAASSGPTPRSVAVYVGFGVAVAGLAVGATTGLLTLTRAADLKPRCPGGVCPPDAGLEGAQALGTASTIAFVVSAAGAAVGVGALLLPGDRPGIRSAAWVRMRLGVGQAAIEGGF